MYTMLLIESRGALFEELVSVSLHWMITLNTYLFTFSWLTLV